MIAAANAPRYSVAISKHGAAGDWIARKLFIAGYLTEFLQKLGTFQAKQSSDLESARDRVIVISFQTG